MKFNIAADLDANVFEENARIYVTLCKSTDEVEKDEAKAVCMPQRTWENLVFYISTLELHLASKRPTVEPLHLGDNVYASYGDYKGVSLIHIRRWDRTRRGHLIPTKKGVVFNDKAWASFKKVVDEINQVMKEYMESDNMFTGTPFKPLMIDEQSPDIYMTHLPT